MDPTTVVTFHAALLLSGIAAFLGCVLGRRSRRSASSGGNTGHPAAAAGTAAATSGDDKTTPRTAFAETPDAAVPALTSPIARVSGRPAETDILTLIGVLGGTAR